LKEHPQAYVDPGQPVSGLVVVGANNLVGITTKPHCFVWLGENAVHPHSEQSQAEMGAAYDR
jgi:hypothetical protein